MAVAGKKVNFNQFAHPKNPYKNGVGDLTDLAAKDGEFNAVAKRNPETNRVKTDWADRAYVKHLMRAVIKRDYGLDLNSHPDSLAPALTNKLNYLLWIEDMAKLNGVEPVRGVDIGTGGAMYFAAIAVKHFSNWQMLATESNPEEFAIASENLQRNGLGSSLVLLFNDDTNRVMRLDDLDTEYFFSMCNPPFYEKNALKRERDEYDGVEAGREHEIAYDGGEVEFITRMIHESAAHKQRIKVFTTLVGHKRNIAVLQEVLKNIGGVAHCVVTEFCQGRTMRWGLAWTFYPEVKLSVIHVRHDAKIDEKAKHPISHSFPVSEAGTHQNCVLLSTAIKTWLGNAEVKVAKEGSKTTDDQCYLRLKTTKTEWRGQRARRRAQEREPASKKLKVSHGADNDNLEEDGDAEVLLDFQLYINKSNDQFVLQFIYLHGPLGKPGMAEIVQYVKNQLKTLV